MAEMVAFVPGTHEADLRALLTAYLEEGTAGLKQAFDFEQDIPAAVDGMMGHLAQFAKPSRRLLLVIEGKHRPGLRCAAAYRPRGCGDQGMYIRPEARGRSLGRQLLEALLIAARQEGYQEGRLDTPGLMPATHRLIAPPASLRALPTLSARSRWSSTIAASSSAAIWPMGPPSHNGATLA